MFRVKYNKYNNAKTYYNGYWYQSKFEAGYAQELDLRLRAGDIKAWERQVPFELRVYGRLITTYKMDFKVYHNDGTIELVETKGAETEAWRYRWKLLEAIINHDHPDWELSVVKSKRTTYQEVKAWKKKVNYSNVHTASKLAKPKSSTRTSTGKK